MQDKDPKIRLRGNRGFLWCHLTVHLHPDFRGSCQIEETTYPGQRSRIELNYSQTTFALCSACLTTTFFELRKSFYWHKRSFVMGSLGSLEQVETSGTELFLWKYPRPLVQVWGWYLG